MRQLFNRISEFVLLKSFKYPLVVYVTLWVSIVVLSNLAFNSSISFAAGESDADDLAMTMWKILHRESAETAEKKPLVFRPYDVAAERAKIDPSRLEELDKQGALVRKALEFVKSRLEQPSEILSTAFTENRELSESELGLVNSFPNGISPALIPLLSYLDSQGFTPENATGLAQTAQFGPYSIPWLRPDAPYLATILNKSDVVYTIDHIRLLMDSIENPYNTLIINDAFNNSYNPTYNPFQDPLVNLVRSIIPEASHPMYSNQNLCFDAAADAWKLAAATRNPVFFHTFAYYATNLTMVNASPHSTISYEAIYNDNFMKIVTHINS